MKVGKITEKEFEAAEAAKAKKGKWTEVIKEVIEEGECQKITELSRGQVAALYRAAKAAGVKVVASYKDNSVSLAPA